MISLDEWRRVVDPPPLLAQYPLTEYRETMLIRLGWWRWERVA